MLFEFVGGIKTKSEVLKALNGRKETWTQLFTPIGNKKNHYKRTSMALMLILKFITCRYYSYIITN
jgi:hypothetical protein